MKRVILGLVAVFVFCSVVSVYGGDLLDRRAGVCKEDWKEGSNYWMQSISTFNPNAPGDGAGHWEVSADGEPMWAYDTLDRRFCRLDGVEGEDIIGAWVAHFDGTRKGWLFGEEDKYSPHDKMEFITVAEFYPLWKWKAL